VKRTNVLSRVRSALRDGWADPIVRYGSVFEGWYELHGSLVTGYLAHAAKVSKRPPISLVVLRDGEPIGSTKSFEPSDEGWRFEVDVGAEFTADDVVKERLHVAALDRVGAQSIIKISGSTQLSYIRRSE